MTSGLQPINSGAPTPVQGVTGGPGINQGTASVEPGTGALVFHPNPANVVQVRGSTPGAFQVYEYFNSNTSYARIALDAQTNGPFLLAVETAPSSVIRGLDINTAGGPLIINAQYTQFNSGITIQGGNIVAGQTINISGLVSAGGGTGVLVIGASSTTTATAGGATALPATPLGYLQWALGTAFIKIPYYAQ